MKTIFVLIFLLANSSDIIAQNNQPHRSNGQTNYYPQTDPLQNISQEIIKISNSVQSFNTGSKELLEKLTVGKGTQLTERQQKLLLGFEVLNRAE